MLDSIAVIGSGAMGTEIALSAAVEGIQVVLYNRKDVSRVETKLNEIVSKYLAKNIILENQAEIIKKNIRVTEDMTSIENSKLIIESLKEDLNLKKDYFKRICEIANQDTIIASNTSTYGISDLTSGLPNQKRFLGLHFFNPAYRMKLVEISYLPETDEKVIEQVKDFVAKINKEYILLGDSPGYVLNKLLLPYVNNAIKLLESGLASAEDIDKAMKLGAGHPMGPIALVDLIGLDVFLSNLKVLFEYTGDLQYKPAALLEEKVKMGKMGRKSGEGFLKYK